MTYRQQLILAALISIASLALFWMATGFLPDARFGETYTTTTAILSGLVMLGLLVSFVLAVAFTTSAVVWMLSAATPDTERMPLGRRLKGAGIIFVIAMLSYASFFLFI